MYDEYMNEENVQGFNVNYIHSKEGRYEMSETVKVKKIKKVIKTKNTNSESIVDPITNMKFDINTYDAEPSKTSVPCGVDLGKSGDVGTCNGEVLPKVVKKVKKIVKNEQIYYVHTCGYDYVVNTIDADVAFSGTKKECDEWVKKHSIVQGLINDSDFDSSNKMSDDELFSLLETSEVENKIVKNEIFRSIKSVKEEIVKYNESDIISFVRTIDLNKEDYSEFTEEKYPYGLTFMDFEVFAYDWLVVLIDVIALKETIIVNNRKALMQFYISHRNKLHASYNGRSYDSTIYKGILLGMNPKKLNDKLIVEGLKPFQISNKFKEIELLNYDIMTKIESLKVLEAYMQDSIYESKISFNIKRPLTMEEIEETIHYCHNDVIECKKVFLLRHDDFEVSMGVIDMFKLPISCINLTNAQLTAKVLECERPKEDRKDEFDLWVVDTIKLEKYKDVIDWFMNPSNHDYSKCYIRDVCGMKHKFGWGGLHSVNDKPMIINEHVQDWDVASLYPSLDIRYKLLTRNCKHPEKFKFIYDERIRLKKAKDPKNKCLKLILNSTYGICKDKNSSAYDPLMSNMTCLTGQLLILMLIEWIEPYIKIWVQTNTDGIQFVAKDGCQEKIELLIHKWEGVSGMNMEVEHILKTYQSNVNNYTFQLDDGSFKRKGAYLKKATPLDADLPIVNEAMFNFLAHGKKVEDTINECDDLYMFQKVYKISSNYKYGYHNGEQIREKVYRIFASKNLKDTWLGKQKENGGTIEKFANCPENCFLELGDIHGKKCSEYPNLNKQWYINLAQDRIEKGYHLDCKPSLFDMF